MALNKNLVLDPNNKFFVELLTSNCVYKAHEQFFISSGFFVL